ncbi:MAG: molecular chaperone HtpG, partial [Oscillospiraceae bacterium]|nr:molecular chaperone HtpG [Oscillospiraceae bacterium]
MAKKQFKAESKRLMDLMINSIYTHKEIFLREIISNASDAIDKLAYLSLTDDTVKAKRSDLRITVTPDKAARTLTVSDNGVGMTAAELEQNLGTIAKSGSLQFKADMEGDKASDIIGQFGVGFYSAFMVADEVTVITRRHGEEDAHRWHSTGADGYTVTQCEKPEPGTDVIMHLKEDTEDEKYGEYLETGRLQSLIKKYSDYIRHPIRMEVEDYRQKEKPEDAGEDYKPEWETVVEEKTINSMVPLWQRPRSKVDQEEYDRFYQEKFADWQAPLATVTTSSEGTVTFKALLFVPSNTPYDFYTR